MSKVNRDNLRQLLAGAVADPAAVLDFYRAILDSTLYVLSKEGVEGAIAVVRDDKDRIMAFAYFSPEDTQDATQPIPARALFAELGSKLHLCLDSEGKHPWILCPRQITALLDGSMFFVDEESFTGQVYTGALRRPRGRLMASLRKVFARHDFIRAAFMVQWFDPRSTFPPSPAVGLIAEDNTSEETIRATMQECMGAWQPEQPGDKKIVFLMSQGDPISLYAVNETHPFYDRETHVPTILGDNEFLEFLRDCPDEPDLSLSMWKKWLVAGSPDVDATAEIAAFNRWASEELVKSIREQSTHAKAKRALIDAIKNDHPFYLYLRNSAFEAREGLTDAANVKSKTKASTYLVHVANITRPVERLLTDMLSDKSVPLISLVNPFETVGPKDILQLEVKMEHWLSIMHGLVTRAHKIFISLASLTSGISEELLAIQIHAREDDTLIVLPAENDSDDFSDLFPGLPPEPERVSPERARRLFSTYGSVISENELEEAVRGRRRGNP